VIRGGAITHSKAYGIAGESKGAGETEGDAVALTSIFEGASMSKPLFGYFVMTFVDEGSLDLDRPLSDYFHDFAVGDDPRIKKITARMILSHQSGLPNWRSNEPNGELNFAFEPGEGFRYSGEGYQYLARALEAIAETDAVGLDALFQQRVAEPMGLTQTRFMPDAETLARKVAPYADGEWRETNTNYSEFGSAYSLHSNAGDFARALIGMGRGIGLSEESHAEFLKGQGVKFAKDDPSRPTGVADWALGFSIVEMPGRRVYMHGGNNYGWTSISALDPEALDGFVVFTNSDQENDFTLELSLFMLQMFGAPQAS
jgi:CubicO group peptidase (beta-lactamase class C family)